MTNQPSNRHVHRAAPLSPFRLGTAGIAYCLRENLSVR